MALAIGDRPTAKAVELHMLFSKEPNPNRPPCQIIGIIPSNIRFGSMAFVV
jgi:hypothetical protein